MAVEETRARIAADPEYQRLLSELTPLQHREQRARRELSQAISDHYWCTIARSTVERQLNARVEAIVRGEA